VADRPKRTLECKLIVETDLDDEQITEICMRTVHEMTKRAEGRLVVAVGQIDGEFFWKSIGVPEKPKPGATVIYKATDPGKT
jgi:hypothetical protein